jgi:3-oxoacyl-[acyl-carrier protein] reductase
MLHAAILFMKFVEEADDQNFRVGAFACRFLAPAFINDLVFFAVDRTVNDDGVDYSFLVLAEDGVELITSGSLQMVRSRETRSSPTSLRSTLFGSQPTQNVRSIDMLSKGLSETLEFEAAPAALTRLLDLVDAVAEPASITRASPAVDPALIALLPISTMVGMRLPGRYGTCVEIEARFASPIRPGLPVTLEAVVERVSAASNRVKLDLAWTQGNARLGMGGATTLVHQAPQPALSCADIKARFLDSGLSGKTALVVGASGGIGDAVARLLAMQGAFVIAHYFQGGGPIARMIEDITANGGRAIGIQADLREDSEIANLLARVRETSAGVDILVHSVAGQIGLKSAETASSAAFSDEFRISVLGLHDIVRGVLPAMKEKRNGRIVVLTAASVDAPSKDQTAYLTAKGAATSYMRSLAAELAGHGITVNAVAPGMTATPLNFEMSQAMIERVASESPTGRLIEPIEVARAVCFLASNGASAVSGQRLVLSQGGVPFL